ncbi:MAG: hypothetical protein PF638_00680 [Candidatus Delongbacteria bacterium]|nr:hypothetical protein [Candidatus Delongbacteria bacterium]
MTKSKRAALLSALVIPGAGHLFLKKRIRGFAFIGLSIMSLYFIISKLLERAYSILEKIEKGEVQPNIVAIMDMVSKQPTGQEAKIISIATYILIITWIISIIDSYRIGKKIQKEKE